MLVLSRREVQDLLDLDALIDALADAMADLSAGRASVPDRIAALVPKREALLAAMPGYVPSLGALVSKLMSLFPQNAGGPIPTHQGVIAVFDPDTGTPIALLDGTEITAVRTGACSALSVRLLAREDASVLAVLGTGVQARSHARAVVRVRPITEVVVAGRDRRKADALATELAADVGVPTRAVNTWREALEQADVVCATAHALEPVVRRTHVSRADHALQIRRRRGPGRGRGSVGASQGPGDGRRPRSRALSELQQHPRVAGGDLTVRVPWCLGWCSGWCRRSCRRSLSVTRDVTGPWRKAWRNAEDSFALGVVDRHRRPFSLRSDLDVVDDVRDVYWAKPNEGVGDAPQERRNVVLAVTSGKVLCEGVKGHPASLPDVI